jgi:hypothetical protein
MINEIVKLAEIADFFISKEWKNIKVDFTIEEINLRFVCDDKNVGYFRASIYYTSRTLLAYIEGENYSGSQIKIGQNIKNYSKDFLYNAFYMCRCCREFERTTDINYSKGFEYYRKKAIDIYLK